MKREKSEKKTPAQPRVDELEDRRSRDLVGLGLFMSYCTALKLQHKCQEEIDRILKRLDERGMTIVEVETDDRNYSLVKKEDK